MVRVSVVVGMNGAAASNSSDVGPDFRQVPVTGGEKVGVPVVLDTGPERFTVTTWSEGTSVAPSAGVVESTVNGVGGTVVVAEPPPDQRGGARRPVVPTGDEGTGGHDHQGRGDTDGDPSSSVAPGRRYEDLVVGHGSKRS